jgi:F-type H+/Na+-transporting ATPase subunit alpha
MHVIDQIMVIYAANVGALDKVDRKAVRKWELQFLTFMTDQMPEVREMLAKERKITDQVAQRLEAAIAAFQPQFKA